VFFEGYEWDHVDSIVFIIIWIWRSIECEKNLMSASEVGCVCVFTSEHKSGGVPRNIKERHPSLLRRHRKLCIHLYNEIPKSCNNYRRELGLILFG
jgi:hypothetical protein